MRFLAYLLRVFSCMVSGTTKLLNGVPNIIFCACALAAFAAWVAEYDRWTSRVNRFPLRSNGRQTKIEVRGPWRATARERERERERERSSPSGGGVSVCRLVECAAPAVMTCHDDTS